MKDSDALELRIVADKYHDDMRTLLGFMKLIQFFSAKQTQNEQQEVAAYVPGSNLRDKVVLCLMRTAKFLQQMDVDSDESCEMDATRLQPGTISGR